MDASAYLQKQGWRGDGHSLDHTNRGIKKPLLVSKKVDVLGVGLNKHQAVSDQWWLRAFDQGLKTFGTGQGSALGAVQKHGINRGGLYARFIQGEGVPGSIGESPVDSGSHTPIEWEPAGDGKVGTNVPPAGKLDQTNLTSEGEKGTHADTALLQNVDDASAHEPSMSNRKRKRTEAAEEKCARRKLERDEKNKARARTNQQKAKADGTWDASEDARRRQDKKISRKADEYVVEAQRRGIIPGGPNEVREKVPKTAQNGKFNEAFESILSNAGLNTDSSADGSAKASEKALQKYDREKMKRAIKRAAKVYLAEEGSQGEPSAQRGKSCKAEKKGRKTKAGKTHDAGDYKGANTIRKNAVPAGSPPNDRDNATSKSQGGDVETGADEIKFGSGRMKTLPGEGIVDHYPTKAEKRAEKQKAPALQEALDGEQQKAVRLGKKSLSPEKLVEYTRRAHLKGVSVEEYIRRREAKSIAKRAEGLKSGKSLRADLPGDDLGFVVDTAGDASLAVKAANSNTVQCDGPLVSTADHEASPNHDHSNEKPATSLDPEVWQGIKSIDMPKDMRKARQQWMKARREERKAQKGSTQQSQPSKQSKGERKVETREHFVGQILFHSRKRLISGNDTSQGTAATIDGVENVPLVKVQTRDGNFGKDEISLAMTVARRVLRNVKREERAKNEKGKEYKKRDRSGKETTINAGISGPTDRARRGSSTKASGHSALLA